MTGKTYKKTVYIRSGPEEKAPDRERAPEEAKKGRPAGAPESPTGKAPATPETSPAGRGPIDRVTSRRRASRDLKVRGSDIRYKILTDKNYAFEQSLFLYEFQTDAEKMVRATIYKNNVGFNKPDAKFFSDMIGKIKEYGGVTRLFTGIGATRTANLVAETQRRMAKYSNQLADIYNDDNSRRNFKTLEDSFKHAKNVTDGYLEGVDRRAVFGDPNDVDPEAFTFFKDTAKTLTKADIEKKADEKKRGPK